MLSGLKPSTFTSVNKKNGKNAASQGLEVPPLLAYLANPGTSPLLAYKQGVHSNLRTNPVAPSSPLQKLTHTIDQHYLLLSAFCILQI